MPSGIEVAKDNVRKFAQYWKKLRDEGKYLPLKQDGTVWVDKVAEEAKVGKSALRQNPALCELYRCAVSETLEAHRKEVEFRLGQEAGSHLRDIETATVDSLSGSGAEKEKVRRLENRVSELESQLAVINVAHQQALERLRKLEGVEREKERLRLLVERYEFQTDNAINPGPY